MKNCYVFVKILQRGDMGPGNHDAIIISDIIFSPEHSHENQIENILPLQNMGMSSFHNNINLLAEAVWYRRWCSEAMHTELQKRVYIAVSQSRNYNEIIFELTKGK